MYFRSGYKDDLIGLKLGKLQEELDYLIGVPTVKRENDFYIFDTLDSVFKGIDLAGDITAGVLVFAGDEIHFQNMRIQFEQKYASMEKL